MARVLLALLSKAVWVGLHVLVCVCVYGGERWPFCLPWKYTLLSSRDSSLQGLPCDPALCTSGESTKRRNRGPARVLCYRTADTLEAQVGPNT